MSTAPYYREVNGEIAKFKAAYREQTAIMLKGPTGCGKTTFVEYMAHELGLGLTTIKKEEKDSHISAIEQSYDDLGLITVACHEDLTASDLLGRYVVKGDSTEFLDGPGLAAVKGKKKMLYLDEVVEARSDVMVLIHPLSDHRRFLPVDKLGKVFYAPLEFCLVVSYNPGYQSLKKELKQSTRQRFSAIALDYPPENIEEEIVSEITGLEKEISHSLVTLGNDIRALKVKGLPEGASTRLLINAAKYIKNQGLPPRIACEFAIKEPLTDSSDLGQAIQHLIDSKFG